MIRLKIPMRLPSLNEYTAKCRIQRGTWNAGNHMKRKTQDDLFVYLLKLPQFKKKNPNTLLVAREEPQT